MIRKFYKYFLISAIALFFGSLTAGPRIIVGLGLQFDPNSLGGTFVKDGLDSGVAKKDANGNYAGQQKIFIAENKLQTLSNITGGVFNYRSNGPMTAGSLTLGFEDDVKSYQDTFGLFYRVGLNMSTVVSGGHKTANFMGYKWYDVRWFYKSMVIPAFFGIKIDVGGTKDKPLFGIYMAPGIHYFRAEWQVKGTIDGAGLEAATGGLSKSLPGAGDAMNPSGYGEDAKFSGSGFGFSFLTGVQARVSDNGFLFIETEYHGSYKQGNAGTKSSGGMAGLSPMPTYPVSVGGTVYRFGYKHEL